MVIIKKLENVFIDIININKIKIYRNINIAVYLNKNFYNFFFLIYLKDRTIYIVLINYFLNIFAYILKNNTILQAKQLLDIFSVDNLELKCTKYRFSVYYVFLSLLLDFRFIVKVFPKKIKNNLFKIISLFFIFKSSFWLERENWDMFGIFFEGNKDLRKILTDYSSKGFPLRKDYPLSGFIDLDFGLYDKRLFMIQLFFSQVNRIILNKNKWY